MSSIAFGAAAVLIGTWIGAIIFHSAVVAPSVFAGLDEPTARRFLRDLFPKFFKLGLICGGLTLAAAGLALWFGAEGASALLAAALLMTILEGISLWMVPSINAARDAGAEGAARFTRLHRISVMLTVLILLIGIAVLYQLGS